MGEHTSLILSLFQINAIELGEYQLKNGTYSPIYINLRKIISYPAILKIVATHVWRKAAKCKFDMICGVPYGALPIATCVSLEHNIPMVMQRKEKKDYGTKQLIEGEIIPGKRCLIIEDIITTGSSSLTTASEIEKAGLKVTDIVALVDREHSTLDSCMHYNMHTVVTLTEILCVLTSSTLLNKNQRQLVNQLMLEKESAC